MGFLLFFVYYMICSIILFLLLFFLYKVFFKKYLSNLIAEKTLLSAFDSLDQKSILDINVENDADQKKEDKKDEKVYTYF